jgi:hypothetical protein
MPSFVDFLRKSGIYAFEKRHTGAEPYLWSHFYPKSDLLGLPQESPSLVGRMGRPKQV